MKYVLVGESFGAFDSRLMIIMQQCVVKQNSDVVTNKNDRLSQPEERNYSEVERCRSNNFFITCPMAAGGTDWGILHFVFKFQQC